MKGARLQGLCLLIGFVVSMGVACNEGRNTALDD